MHAHTSASPGKLSHPLAQAVQYIPVFSDHKAPLAVAVVHSRYLQASTNMRLDLSERLIAASVRQLTEQLSICPVTITVNVSALPTVMIGRAES